jgi:hypothetical protein
MAKNVLRPDFKAPKPPRSLGAPGANLWARIVEEYDVSDSGGRELLTLACQSLDRAESLREQIDRDGEIIRLKGGLRDHPGLRHELANRAFISKALAKLGVNVEVPVRSPGRPGGMGNLGVGDEYVRRILGTEE